MIPTAYHLGATLLRILPTIRQETDRSGNLVVNQGGGLMLMQVILLSLTTRSVINTALLSRMGYGGCSGLTAPRLALAASFVLVSSGSGVGQPAHHIMLLHHLPALALAASPRVGSPPTARRPPQQLGPSKETVTEKLANS